MQNSPYGQARRTYGSSQIQFLKNLIPVILLDPQITPRDRKRGMIVDIHQHHFRHVLFPRMIAKRLPQRMTADLALYPVHGTCLAYDRIRLRARDRLAVRPVIAEDLVRPGSRLPIGSV